MKYTFEAPVVLFSHKTGEVVEGSKSASERINLFINDSSDSELSEYLNEEVHGELADIVTKISPTAKYSGSSVISTTECETTQELDKDQIKKLTDYITGQFSDGWGEGFEQQPIPVDREYIYAEFWSSGDNWEMKLV